MDRAHIRRRNFKEGSNQPKPTISATTPASAMFPINPLINPFSYLLDSVGLGLLINPTNPTNPATSESTNTQSKESAGTNVKESTITTTTNNENVDNESNNENVDNESKNESAKNESKNESTNNESPNESPNESTNESTNESKNESTNKFPNESTNESTNESKNESTNEYDMNEAVNSKNESTKNESQNESTIESPNESINESQNESTIKSTNESINESQNESTIESTNESPNEYNMNEAVKSESKSKSTHSSKSDNEDEQSLVEECSIAPEAPNRPPVYPACRVVYFKKSDDSCGCRACTFEDLNQTPAQVVRKYLQTAPYCVLQNIDSKAEETLILCKGKQLQDEDTWASLGFQEEQITDGTVVPLVTLTSHKSSVKPLEHEKAINTYFGIKEPGHFLLTEVQVWELDMKEKTLFIRTDEVNAPESSGGKHGHAILNKYLDKNFLRPQNGLRAFLLGADPSAGFALTQGSTIKGKTIVLLLPPMALENHKLIAKHVKKQWGDGIKLADMITDQVLDTGSSAQNQVLDTGSSAQNPSNSELSPADGADPAAFLRKKEEERYAERIVTIMAPRHTTVTELRQKLKDKHLKLTGRKANLAERLLQAMKDDGSLLAEALEELDVSCLKGMLGQLKLALGGSKAAKVARLVEHLQQKKRQEACDFGEVDQETECKPKKLKSPSFEQTKAAFKAAMAVFGKERIRRLEKLSLAVSMCKNFVDGVTALDVVLPEELDTVRDKWHRNIVGKGLMKGGTLPDGIPGFKRLSQNIRLPLYNLYVEVYDCAGKDEEKSKEFYKWRTMMDYLRRIRKIMLRVHFCCKLSRQASYTYVQEQFGDCMTQRNVDEKEALVCRTLFKENFPTSYEDLSDESKVQNTRSNTGATKGKGKGKRKGSSTRTGANKRAKKVSESEEELSSDEEMQPVEDPPKKRKKVDPESLGLEEACDDTGITRRASKRIRETVIPKQLESGPPKLNARGIVTTQASEEFKTQALQTVQDLDLLLAALKHQGLTPYDWQKELQQIINAQDEFNFGCIMALLVSDGGIVDKHVVGAITKFKAEGVLNAKEISKAAPARLEGWLVETNIHNPAQKVKTIVAVATALIERTAFPNSLEELLSLLDLSSASDQPEYCDQPECCAAIMAAKLGNTSTGPAVNADVACASIGFQLADYDQEFVLDKKYLKYNNRRLVGCQDTPAMDVIDVSSPEARKRVHTMLDEIFPKDKAHSACLTMANIGMLLNGRADGYESGQQPMDVVLKCLQQQLNLDTDGEARLTKGLTQTTDYYGILAKMEEHKHKTDISEGTKNTSGIWLQRLSCPAGEQKQAVLK